MQETLISDIPFNTWFPVVTLVAGFVMKAISDRLDHKRILQRERENRRETRLAQLAEKRAEFQRQTLLDLQEALQDLARAAGAIHHYQTMASKKTEKWRHILPDDMDMALFNANRKCILLAVRVRDDKIRKLAQLFRKSTLDASDARSESEAWEMMMKSTNMLPELHEKIANVYANSRMRKTKQLQDTLLLSILLNRKGGRYLSVEKFGQLPPNNSAHSVFAVVSDKFRLI